MSASYQPADPFSSAAFEALELFVSEALSSSADSTESFEKFETELRERIAAFETEVVARRLEQYDVDAALVEVHGEQFRRKAVYEKEYHCLSGSFTVKRALYVPRDGVGRGVVPLDYRAGIVEGAWTPRAARSMAHAAASTTPREAAELFESFGGYKPSTSTLDRLPKALSDMWENQRETFEQDLREQEIIPAEAVAVGVALDGVLVPIRPERESGKGSKPRKTGEVTRSYHEASCGTISFYDADGERIETVRYSRAPEYKKRTLKQQLQAELESIFATRPDLTLVCLSDGATDHWEFLDALGKRLGVKEVRRAVDFFHVAERVKTALDAAHGEGTAESRAEYEKLRVVLKESENGAARVLRSLRHQRDRLTGARRATVAEQVTYLENRKKAGLLNYKALRDEKLPIGSGVVEASCKTLVTQRVKRSGMNWDVRYRGLQAILTLRALIQSNRWAAGWALLSRHYTPTVTIIEDRGVAA